MIDFLMIGCLTLCSLAWWYTRKERIRTEELLTRIEDEVIYVYLDLEAMEIVKIDVVSKRAEGFRQNADWN